MAQESQRVLSAHGGILRELIVPASESLRHGIVELPRRNLTPRQIQDLELLMVGAFSPLAGFLTQEQHGAVVETMRLPDGAVWPIPIVLDVEDDASYGEGDSVVLCDQFGNPLAVFDVTSRYRPDKEREAQLVYGTQDPAHPGVRRLMRETGPVYLGGAVRGIALPVRHDFRDLRHTPRELREMFARKGWDRVIGFQTRNPLHRAHVELIRRAAKEHQARVLIHPVVGSTKEGDIDYITRVRSYKALHRHYVGDIATVSLLPLAMRMAGPREAVWHAIIRRNYGCTHFIVGRDHAGPGSDGSGKPFYGPYEAQELVGQYAGEIEIAVIPFAEMAYVEEEKGYRTQEEIRPNYTVRRISGSELRRMLREGLEPPPWFSYPEVIEELRKGVARERRRGFTIFFTGLPSAGKSTIAHILHTKLLELQDRAITVLDGDVVRQHLSKGLGFSREDRNANVERIGFVASEITKHGGVAVCAAVAPYAEARERNRRLIESHGPYIEIYVSTPAEVCAQRDPKGLYEKARKGLIKGFTGVDDPYEVPERPEMVADTVVCGPEESADAVIAYLRERGLLSG